MMFEELLVQYKLFVARSGPIETDSVTVVDAMVKELRAIKVTAHSNNRNSKSSREVILGSVRL